MLLTLPTSIISSPCNLHCLCHAICAPWNYTLWGHIECSIIILRTYLETVADLAELALALAFNYFIQDVYHGATDKLKIRIHPFSVSG